MKYNKIKTYLLMEAPDGYQSWIPFKYAYLAMTIGYILIGGMRHAQ